MGQSPSGQADHEPGRANVHRFDRNYRGVRLSLHEVARQHAHTSACCAPARRPAARLQRGMSAGCLIRRPRPGAVARLP